MSALGKIFAGLLILSICSASYSQERNPPNYEAYHYSKNGIHLSSYKYRDEIAKYEIIASNCLPKSTLDAIVADCLFKIKVTRFNNIEDVLEQKVQSVLDNESRNTLLNTVLGNGLALIEGVLRTPASFDLAKRRLVGHLNEIVLANQQRTKLAQGEASPEGNGQGQGEASPEGSGQRSAY